MIKITPFKAEHYRKLTLQEGQQYLTSFIPAALMVEMERADNVQGYTMLDGEEVLGCAGIMLMWPGRALAWALLSNQLKNNMLRFHRAVKRFLDTCDVERIEATVDCDFEPGHKWIQMLGFKQEAERMHRYRPDGGDCSLYARVVN